MADSGNESVEPGDLSPEEAAFGHVGRQRTTTGGNKEDNSSETAVYECRCGHQETYHEKEWDHLRWVRRRVRLKNIPETVAYLTNCCDRPSYMEVS